MMVAVAGSAEAQGIISDATVYEIQRRASGPTMILTAGEGCSLEFQIPYATPKRVFATMICGPAEGWSGGSYFDAPSGLKYASTRMIGFVSDPIRDDGRAENMPVKTYNWQFACVVKRGDKYRFNTRCKGMKDPDGFFAFQNSASVEITFIKTGAFVPANTRPNDWRSKQHTVKFDSSDFMKGLRTVARLSTKPATMVEQVDIPTYNVDSITVQPVTPDSAYTTDSATSAF